MEQNNPRTVICDECPLFFYNYRMIVQDMQCILGYDQSRNKDTGKHLSKNCLLKHIQYTYDVTYEPEQLKDNNGTHL